ncbi:hypothetical protein [Albidovulum inexpectatum]|uniref:hypothetical protein n=1 Tax=Albidovulum inexpectatum TaxID=196587 RepID=UPI0011AFD94F|nr:hypothetical protein [Albidovulum inexpectatum]
MFVVVPMMRDPAWQTEIRQTRTDSDPSFPAMADMGHDMPCRMRAGSWSGAVCGRETVSAGNAHDEKKCDGKRPAIR